MNVYACESAAPQTDCLGLHQEGKLRARPVNVLPVFQMQDMIIQEKAKDALFHAGQRKLDCAATVKAKILPEQKRQEELCKMLDAMPSYKRKAKQQLSQTREDKRHRSEESVSSIQAEPVVSLDHPAYAPLLKEEEISKADEMKDPMADKRRRADILAPKPQRLQKRSRLEPSLGTHSTQASLTLAGIRPGATKAPTKGKVTKLKKMRRQFNKNRPRGKANPLTVREDLPKRRVGHEELGTGISRPLQHMRREDVEVSQRSAQQVQVASKNRKKKWTPEDDQILREAVEKYGNQWSWISEKFFGDCNLNKRCRSRYMRHLHPKLIKGFWTEEEREKLCLAVDQYGTTNWAKIAKKVFVWTRSDIACRMEYLGVLDADIRHEKWPKEEDQQLIELVESGLGWSAIARQIPGRTLGQCYLRYQILNPDVIKGPMSAEEIEKLKAGQQKFGKDYAEISKQIFEGKRSRLQCRRVLLSLEKNEFALELEKKLTSSSRAENEDENANLSDRT